MKIKNILAHRGCWSSTVRQNSRAAIYSALSNGFGLETDIRDFDGEIVISHDPPKSKFDLSCFDLFQMMQTNRFDGRIALNVKSDGLQNMLKYQLSQFNDISGHLFVFDMSVPDMLQYKNAGLQFYSRTSDIEPFIALQDSAFGVWVDNFYGEFDQIKIAKSIIDRGLRVSLVSPELHGREHLGLWRDIKNSGLYLHSSFEICTDFPFEALEYFVD